MAALQVRVLLLIYKAQTDHMPSAPVFMAVVRGRTGQTCLRDVLRAVAARIEIEGKKILKYPLDKRHMLCVQ